MMPTTRSIAVCIATLVRRALRSAAFVLAVMVAGNLARGDSFAVEVVEYLPAPGFLVQDDYFNDPTAALGAPDGAGVVSGAAENIVTLGGFGGTITLAFDHRVMDEPLNPHGLDAIVFGNAFWLGFDAASADPETRWAECATIEISADRNLNGLADDEWFLIPGSHLAGPALARSVATWDADTSDDGFPPASASWIPAWTAPWVPAGFPGPWQSTAYLLPSGVFGQPVIVNPGVGGEGVFGYADYSPTLILGDLDADDVVEDAQMLPEAFYTVPDDPHEIGITNGSGGGDAFDIKWAVNPDTWEPAELEGFDFIRISNGVHWVFSSDFDDVFEVSPEIDGVSDVAPDPFGDFDDDGDIDLFDAGGLMNCLAEAEVGEAPCARVDREPNDLIDVDDWSAQVERMTGPIP